MPFGAHQATGTIDNERLLVQDGYIMQHDDDLRTAIWTAHRLTLKDRINATKKQRVNCFRRDPRIEPANTAVLDDYEEKIFDRGHMTNDADLKYDLREQINTYVLSNMSAQHCRFNRGIWLSLEALSRKWAERYDTIHVTSGAIYDRNNDNARDNDDDATHMKSDDGNERVGVPSS